jgi:hypothetical protein
MLGQYGFQFERVNGAQNGMVYLQHKTYSKATRRLAVASQEKPALACVKRLPDKSYLSYL